LGSSRSSSDSAKSRSSSTMRTRLCMSASPIAAC
jgi:hypothetical protein